MVKSERLPSVTEGIALVVIAAAFASIQIMIGGTRMTFCLPSYGALGVVGLLALFSLRRPKVSPSQWCLAVTALCMGYVLTRAWLSPVPYIARSDLYSVLAGLLVYYFTACILTSAPQRMALICFLLVLALGHNFVGALQFRDGTNFMPISWLQRCDYGRRASGFYICPNHLAGLLEVIGIFGVSVVCWSRWPVWAKMLIGYATAICYVGIILTGSRGGYLSGGASLLVFAILSFTILRRTSGGLLWKIGGVGVLVTLLAGVFAVSAISKSPFLANRAQNTFETSNMRIDLWRGALQQWKLAPILGTGSGTYLYYGRFFRTDRVQEDPIYTHNDYLNFLAEYGIVGAAGMFAFLGVHLWRGSQSFVRLGPKRVAVSQRILSNGLALNVGAIAAVSSYLVHSALDFNLHIPANLLLMAFVFGLLANDGVLRDRPAPRAKSSDLRWRIALPVLGLALLLSCVRLLPGEYLAERARMAVRDEQPGLAIRFARAGLEHDISNPDLHYYLGAARIQLAERMEIPAAAASFRTEGIIEFEKALALAPKEESYLLELASALDASDRFEEAEWTFYQTLQLDPKSISVQRYYQRHLELWGDPSLLREVAAGQGS
ncbi:MAG: O-antigen ligase family protein [Verrucomicrobiota bacterium]|nr:O-antigen ligase family protein [Verrucomicrobiota bacterium]